MKKFMIFLILIMSFSSLFAADFIAINTKIVGVSATTSSGTSGKFWVNVSGGTRSSTCSSGRIYFETNSNLDADTFKRIYTMTLTAISTGKTANIYQYTSADGNCYAHALDLEN